MSRGDMQEPELQLRPLIEMIDKSMVEKDMPSFPMVRRDKKKLLLSEEETSTTRIVASTRC